MFFTRLLRCFFGSLAFLIASSASAIVIEYEQVAQSGDHYQYNYSVTNDSTQDIDAFTIFFEANAYQNLTGMGSPPDWDLFIVEPDPFLGDGFTDWIAFGMPIAAGEMLNGFNIAFDWVAPASTPFDSQAFEVYDPLTFGVYASGFTQKLPEPGVYLLIVIALIGWWFSGTRTKPFVRQMAATPA